MQKLENGSKCTHVMVRAYRNKAQQDRNTAPKDRNTAQQRYNYFLYYPLLLPIVTTPRCERQKKRNSN